MSKKYEKYQTKNLDEKLNILFIQDQILRCEIIQLIGYVVLIGLLIIPFTNNSFIDILTIVFEVLLFIALHKGNKQIKDLKKLTGLED